MLLAHYHPATVLTEVFDQVLVFLLGEVVQREAEAA